MKVLRRSWFQIFVGGIILLFLVEWALATTGNPNYIPSVIVLGAFLVPVTFVSYLYERLQDWGVTLRSVVLCFLWGGVLGTVVAGILEYLVAVALGFLPKISIGLIEELAKLIVPLIFYFLGERRRGQAFRRKAAFVAEGLFASLLAEPLLGSTADLQRSSATMNAEVGKIPERSLGRTPGAPRYEGHGPLR
jgi:hypothetical protein